MKIGVDIDDVLAQFQIGWLKYHNENYDTQLAFDDITDFDYSNFIKEDIEVIIDRIKDFYKTTSFKNLSPLPDSISSIKTLSVNHDLYILTSRPQWTKEATLNWLSKHYEDSFAHTTFTGQMENKKKITKGYVCERFGIDVMIEDAPKYMD